MTEKVLIIGATGNVGSHVVKELDADSTGVAVRLSSSQPETVEQWQAAGKEAALLDLDRPATFAEALTGVDRVFLLTGYTAAMLYQSKKLVDAAVDAGVSHIVHLGVFASGRDDIPHFTWHQLVEEYIKASGVAWTNIHANVIWSDSMAASVFESDTYTAFWGDALQGYVCTSDIGAVAAAILREGPSKHAGTDYWLSTEVLSGTEIAETLSDVLGRKITYKAGSPEDLAEQISQIPSAGTRLYMESAVQTMREAVAGRMTFQRVVRDDVQTVLGRPGITIRQWATMKAAVSG